jgi:hypothetical protein
MVCDIGEQKQVAACVARLFDSATCPSSLHVYILESVASIKAEDFLASELRRCAELAPTYGYYYSSQIHLHRTHQSRRLIGVHGISHLLETLETTLEDTIMIVPSKLWTVDGWDEQARKETVAAWALKTTPAFSVESWYNGTAPVAGFFAFTDDLSFSVVPMARPSHVAALGMSLRHPLVLPYKNARRVFQKAAELDVGEDAALSYLVYRTGITLQHPDSILGTVDSSPRVPSPVEAASVRKVLEAFPDKRVAWLDRVSLTDDLEVCGKSAMGMVTDTLGEMVIKWGSKGAFDTEKEAMQYG